MSTIKPITQDQQQQVIERVADLLQQCAEYFNRPFKPIEIRFDLRGRTSGMYVVRNTQQYLRFNPFIFSKFFEDSLNNTVPHEVAHYVSHELFGIKNIRPHGKQWKAIMNTLGAEPRVTGNYDLAGIAVKKQRRFDYRCGCMNHQLTTVRHNRVLIGKSQYFCTKCNEELTHQAAINNNLPE